jgi:cell division protein FtsB
MALLRLIKHLFWLNRGNLLWLFLVAAIAVGWGVLQREAISDFLNDLDRRNLEQERTDNLGREIKQLEREKQVLAEDGYERERVARKRYKLSKPGEDILYLEYPTEDSGTASLPGAAEPALPPEPPAD